MPFELTEYEKVMECIKALYFIDGYIVYSDNEINKKVFNNIDLIMKYLEDKKKELNKTKGIENECNSKTNRYIRKEDKN